jgi:hypothetical protein
MGAAWSSDEAQNETEVDEPAERSHDTTETATRPEGVREPVRARDDLEQLRATALATLPKKNQMVEVVGAARAVVAALHIAGATEYTELARYAGHVVFDPAQWAPHSAIADSEAYPIVVVGGRFEADGRYTTTIDDSFAGRPMSPLLRGDPAVVVRLYARFAAKETWPIRAVNVAVLPMLGWYVNDGEFGRLCTGKICLAPSVQVLGVERSVAATRVETEARALACHVNLRINPAGCHACALSKELAHASVWQPRLEACKRAMTSSDTPTHTFFLLHCPHRMDPGETGVASSDAGCNRLIVSRTRLSDGTSMYALIRTVTRFILRVAQMTATMGGVDPDLISELGDLGFYETDPDFRHLLLAQVGKRILCHRLDYDELGHVLTRLFKKGYEWRRFAMRAEVAADVSPDARPTLATAGDPVDVHGDVLSEKLKQFGFSSKNARGKAS